MLLTLDIGNTNINAGLWKGDKLKKSFYFPGNIRSYIKNVNDCVIASVCPKKLSAALKELKQVYEGNIYIVGKDIKVPLKSEYNPRQIGQDRLVTAYAVMRLYGTPVLVLDFGTAMTFDMVSKEGVYKGGLILPGIKMSLESLHSKTALLPEVSLAKADGFVGKDTLHSIRNGIIYGYKSMAEGIIRKFKKMYPGIKIVATGGNAKLIIGYTGIRGIKIDENLALYGLKAILDT